MKWPGVIEAYRSYLPVTDKTPVVTLLEGNTPLIPVPNFVKAIGGNFELHLKYEGLNPTGSFKDRGLTLSVSKAKERGAKTVICASTGNTSAAASAYAARGGLKCVVILPSGKIAQGKLAQACMYGAKIVMIEGNFDDALKIVRELGKDPEFEIVNSINPYRVQSQKTASFEICDALGRAPDYHFIPVGNAANIYAYWLGYKEYFETGKVTSIPKMMGWQASGAAPIVDGKPYDKPETICTAIRIGNPASWKPALEAVNSSHGTFDKVTDEETLVAYQLLAKTEGVFAEPSSCVPLAGLMRMVKERKIPEGSIITSTLTGHGLKDPNTALEVKHLNLTSVPANIDDVKRRLKE
jgi:threonine synthase